MTDDEKTDAVGRCRTFSELETVIRDNEPFISNSRDTPVEWTSDRLIRRIFIVIDGGPASNVTRANGLRYKVIELCSRMF